MDAITASASTTVSTLDKSVIRISSRARKFHTTLVIVFNALKVISLMEYSILGAFVGAHLGEPCNSLLRICLPPSPYIHCNANFTCRCKSDFPVEIQPHTCKAPRKIGERCSYNEECSFLDLNAHCAKEYEECQCLDGFHYSFADERCVPGKSKNVPREDPRATFFPWTIIFFLACFGLICGISFVWYMFCSCQKQSDDENSSNDNQLDPLNGGTDGHRRRNGARRPGGHRHNRHRNNNRSSHLNGDSGGLGRSNDPPPSLLQLPSYKSALHYNQPPPSYDEAVRETTLEAVVVPEVVNYISDQATNSIGPQASFSSSPASHGER